MKIIKCLALIICITSVTAQAATLKDIKKSDPSYSAVKSSVSKGYLPVFKDNKFLPDRSVTRREMSIIIQKLSKRDAKSLGLTKAEMQELKSLASSFKGYIADQDAISSKVGGRVNTVEKEQKLLHYDMSKLNVEMDSLRKENKQQKNFIWSALALGALGVLL